MAAAPSRLLTLDAMRGLAAVMVLLHHVDNGIAPSGYLSVDFFFLLSGFVIARTYNDDLADSSLTFVQFVRLRSLRLYPLFVIGLMIGTMRAIAQTALARPEHMSAPALVVSVLCELFFLPSPAGTVLFPLNLPAWSLFFEMAVNVVYAAFMVRMRLRSLLGVALVAAASLSWVAGWNGSLDAGWEWRSFSGGIARVVFAFTVGLIMARLPSAPARRGAWALVPMAALVALLLIPASGPARAFYDLFVALVAAPALVWMGAAFEPGTEAWRGLSRRLGDWSYPVYVIHYPILVSIGFAVRRSGAPYAVWVPIFIVLTVTAASTLNRYWDRPIRARLARRASIDTEAL